MSEIFDRFRSTAGKAAFEAEKIRKINTLQSKIKSLKTETEKSFFSAGRLVFFIYQQGEVNQPALVTACEKLRQLHEEISSMEQEIENIRQEEYVAPPPSNVSAEKICPNGHGSIPKGTKFCQMCGAQGVEEQPAAAPGCDNCGTPLQKGAKFCAGCGQPVKQKKEVIQKINTCDNCGAEQPVGAQFCVECGATLQESASFKNQADSAQLATTDENYLGIDLDQESSYEPGDVFSTEESENNVTLNREDAKDWSGFKEFFEDSKE